MTVKVYEIKPDIDYQYLLFADTAEAAKERAGSKGTSSDPMNLQPLKPSRKRPLAGDVFTMKLPGPRYLFGRVISIDAKAGRSWPGFVLIYIYATTASGPVQPNPAQLKPGNLLIPPIITNRLPWSRGYFETVGNLPLTVGDVLAQHCFRSSSGKYYDETGAELPGEVQPCADWGLHSFRTIDDAVSAALGIDPSE